MKIFQLKTITAKHKNSNREIWEGEKRNEALRRSGKMLGITLLAGAMTSCFQACLERNRKQEASFGLFNLASSFFKDELVSFVIPMLTAGFAT